MQTLGEDRILIRPDDCIIDIPEFPDGIEPRSRCRLYVSPYGLNAIEVCEANYYLGTRVPYHEHAAGYETFLVDGGSFDIRSMGKRSVAKYGDMVHFAPYMPHSIGALEDNSLWRAFHQELFMTHMMYAEQRLRAQTPNMMNDPAFRKRNAERHASMYYEFTAAEQDVPPEEIPAIRPYDFGFAHYEFEGIDLRLKVGRWETRGTKEIWQMRMKKGFTFSWTGTNPFDNLFDVFNGRMEVRLDGHEPFIAETRDILFIPKWIAGSFTMLEDTVLIDANCQGCLLRSLDELNGWKNNDPQKLHDEAAVREVFLKNDYNNFFTLI